MDYEKLAQDAAKSVSVNSVSGKEMTEIFGITKGRVSQLAKEGVFIRAGETGYDLKESVRNYLRLSRTAAASAPLIKAKVAKAEADARVAKIAADIAERESIKVSEVESIVEEIGVTIRGTLLSMRQTLPERLAGLNAENIALILDEEIARIMRLLYDSKI